MLDIEGFLVLRDLFNHGWSISEIARETGHSRVTVRKYIHSQVPPKPEKRSKRPSKLDDFKEYIDHRLQDYPLQQLEFIVRSKNRDSRANILS